MCSKKRNVGQTLRFFVLSRELFLYGRKCAARDRTVPARKNNLKKILTEEQSGYIIAMY